MCCLFTVWNFEHIFTGNIATSDTLREHIDIKMIEHVAHEYEDVAHEYEVPVSMIKMKECEAYAPLPYKPWQLQEWF